MSPTERITVPEAAKMLGVTAQFLRIALQQKRVHFGIAVQFGKRWSYYIHPEIFRAYVAGWVQREEREAQ